MPVENTPPSQAMTKKTPKINKAGGKHWKKGKAKVPTKKDTETKLLSEGDHLLDPAHDLLESPEQSLPPDTTSK